MKIFVITHTNYGYDVYNGHVVIANDESEVRQLAKSLACGEGEDVWDVAEIQQVGIYIDSKKEPFILLSDFSAG